MALALVAAIVALVTSHLAPGVSGLRRFGWLAAWRRAVARLGKMPAAVALGFLVLLPTVLLSGADYWLGARFYGLGALLLAIGVLLYALGPRDLDRDLAALTLADDPMSRAAALDALGVAPTQPTLPAALVDAVFRAALARWFAPLFWFVVLGPAGAFGYRLAERLADSAAIGGDDAALERAAKALARALEWPAAQLMTLALALAADFDAVRGAWRDWHRDSGRWIDPDAGFLYAAARASVDTDPIDGAGPKAAQSNGNPEANDAHGLVWRVLTVWGIMFAIVVLVGVIS